MSLSDELLTLSSVEMRRRIGTKEISPVELVEASIARIEALNPAVTDICLNRPGQRHLVKIIDRDELRADNLTIIELQRGQPVYSQHKEDHPVYPSVPHATDLAYQLQRRIGHEADLFR